MKKFKRISAICILSIMLIAIMSTTAMAATSKDGVILTNGSSSTTTIELTKSFNACTYTPTCSSNSGYFILHFKNVNNPSNSYSIYFNAGRGMIDYSNLGVTMVKGTYNVSVAANTCGMSSVIITFKNR